MRSLGEPGLGGELLISSCSTEKRSAQAQGASQRQQGYSHHDAACELLFLVTSRHAFDGDAAISMLHVVHVGLVGGKDALWIY